jgi:predicted nuclease of predicted toxin-antitoxin system
MKFLLDVHIPVALKFFLVWKGFEAIHVKDILNGVHTKDKEISKFADANDMVLITKDNDFKNSFFVHKIPKKIIRITLGNCSNEALISCFEKHLETISNFKDEAFYSEIDSFSIIFFSKGIEID